MVDFTLEQNAIFNADSIFIDADGNWNEEAFDICAEHAGISDSEGFVVYLMNGDVEERREWKTFLAECRLDRVSEKFIEALEAARSAGANWATFLE